MSNNVGHIFQVIGPVVDVVFASNAEHQAQLPAINEALTVKRPDGRCSSTSVRTLCVVWRWTQQMDFVEDSKRLLQVLLSQCLLVIR